MNRNFKPEDGTMTKKMNAADLDRVRGGITRMAPNTHQGPANEWKPSDDGGDADAK